MPEYGRSKLAFYLICRSIKIVLRQWEPDKRPWVGITASRHAWIQTLQTCLRSDLKTGPSKSSRATESLTKDLESAYQPADLYCPILLCTGINFSNTATFLVVWNIFILHFTMAGAYRKLYRLPALAHNITPAQYYVFWKYKPINSSATLV